MCWCDSAHGFSFRTLQTEAIVLKQSVVLSSVRKVLWGEGRKGKGRKGGRGRRGGRRWREGERGMRGGRRWRKGGREEQEKRRNRR